MYTNGKREVAAGIGRFTPICRIIGIARAPKNSDKPLPYIGSIDVIK